MCLDWKWNQQPLGAQDNTEPTEPHQPELQLQNTFYNIILFELIQSIALHGGQDS